MYRLYDPEECRGVTDKHLDYFSFDAEKWLSEEKNVALKDGANIAFGEYKLPGVYFVHFCFHTAKGRTAIELTKEMLETFSELAPVRICIGLITEENKKARWLIRQVGFTSLDMVETELGLCEMFYWKRK